MPMFQPFKRATRAQTPDLSTATAQQGVLESQAKMRSNALRQQNIGNTMGAAKLYNENVDGTPIADYMDTYNSPTADLNAPLPASEAPAMSSTAPMSPAATPDPFTTMGSGPVGPGAEMLAAEGGAEAAAAAELGTAAEIGTATTGTAAGSGVMSSLGTAMPYVGAAMALYSLLNQ